MPGFDFGRPRICEAENASILMFPLNRRYGRRPPSVITTSVFQPPLLGVATE